MRQRKPTALSTIAATAALLTAALLAAALPAAPALATPPVTCGMTVTTDIALTRDLTCPEAGLIIGADGITIDLGGHTLTGSGASTSTHDGIAAYGHSDLRIQRGTITGFRQAIALREVRNILLRRLRITGNAPITGTYAGTLFIDGGQNIDIRDTQLIQPERTRTVWANISRGVWMERVRASGYLTWVISSDLTMIRSVFTDASIGLFESVRADIRHNLMRRSSVDMSEASLVTIADNRFMGPDGGPAIDIDLAYTPVIERNVISGAREGVVIGVPEVREARIAHNTFVDNDYGVKLVERDLIGGNLLVSDNLFTGNRKAGVFFEATNALPIGGPLTVTRNRFVRNGHGSTDTDAAGRTINDGIHTNLPVGSLLTIADNRTYFNADHGIEALPAGSVIDGGGNRSVGDPNGCAGVTCGSPASRPPV